MHKKIITLIAADSILLACNTKDALVDSRFRTWPADNTYVVYPNGRSSIRFEQLMECIQDAKIIRIVRAELEQDNTPKGKESLAEFNQMLELF